MLLGRASVYTEEEAPPHLSVPVDIRLPAGINRYSPVTALVDSGAVFNFISQSVADRLRLRPTAKPPPPISTIDGNPLRTHAVYRVTLRLRDDSGREQRVAANLIGADIASYDLILGMAWLSRHNPDIMWRQQKWYWRSNVAKGDESVLLENPAEFYTSMRAKGANLYAVTVLDRRVPAVGLAATLTEESTIPNEFEDLADEFSADEARGLPAHGPQDLAIKLQDGKQPPWGPIYNLSEKELGVLREYIETYLERGWIQPSTSPASAPVFFVPKKDGAMRLCVDYRSLNLITKKNRYPLPLIGEAIDRLSGARYFTKLDIRDAYHRVRIKKGDEWKTAFRTRYGHFEYNVVAFGLANAPAAFQGYVNQVLRECLDLFCIAYLDDIVVYSDTREEHTAHVRQVLERLKTTGLYLKLSKCQFYAKQIGFVGFIITPDSIEMEPDRIRTVAEWPVPASHRDIQVFLGFANFYRRFIRNFSKIAKPMSDMLKGGKAGKFTAVFRPTPEMIDAFHRLQQAFTKAPVLIHFDPEKPIRLDTDSSGFAIAGIISQLAGSDRDQAAESSAPSGGKPSSRDWHPVAFWSRSMTPAERNYTVGDQEMLAIVMSCRHWRHYLEGARYPVTVLTDYHNLQRFMSTKALTGRQARWWETLSGYDLDIVYRAGKKNPADAPSRRPDYMLGATLRQRPGEMPANGRSDSGQATNCYSPREMQSLRVFRYLVASAMLEDEPFAEMPPDNLKDLIRKSQHSESMAEAASLALQPLGTAPGDSRAVPEKKAEFYRKNWSHSSDGLLYYRGLLYVPNEGGARQEILRQHHDHPTAGHFGDKRTENLVTRKYFWPGLHRDVVEYCATCAVCRQIKAPTHRKYGELQSLPTPTEP